METHERIKYLRKEILKMSQTDFGNAIGVSRDVINNIESNRLKNPGQKEPLYILISQKFNVNLAWIKCESDTMETPLSMAQEAASIARDAVKHNKDEAAKTFHNFVDGLTEAEILLAYEIFKRWKERNK